MLGNLATIAPEGIEALVSHFNLRPAVDIYVSVEGRALGGVAGEVEKIVDAAQPTLPRGTEIALRGQAATMKSSYFGLSAGVAVAIVLVYLLIVINFQSLLDPLIIISALPAALAGIAWMLFITGTHLSVPALTGAIMTTGVATANSILLVSFARERLRQGSGPLSAALEAGATRIRPVLMTAFAMIVGMIPMALGSRRRRRAECAAGPRRHRRPAFRHFFHPSLRSAGFRRGAQPPRPQDRPIGRSRGDARAVSRTQHQNLALNSDDGHLHLPRRQKVWRGAMRFVLIVALLLGLGAARVAGAARGEQGRAGSAIARRPAHIRHHGHADAEQIRRRC